MKSRVFTLLCTALRCVEGWHNNIMQRQNKRKKCLSWIIKLAKKKKKPVVLVSLFSTGHGMWIKKCTVEYIVYSFFLESTNASDLAPNSSRFENLCNTHSNSNPTISWTFRCVEKFLYSTLLKKSQKLFIFQGFLNKKVGGPCSLFMEMWSWFLQRLWAQSIWTNKKNI